MTQSAGTGVNSFSPAIGEAFNYTNWCIRQFDDELKGRILEVGLGHGSYYPSLRARGEYVGVEIDAQLVSAARARFPDGDFRQADVTEDGFLDRIGGAPFDAIVCFNVLEHIEDDDAVVSCLLSILTPNGKLCLLVPAMQFLYNDMDRLAGHYRRYSLKRLQALAEAAKADLVELRYFNPVGGMGWLANKLLPHRSLADRSINSQIEFFDRYLIPLSQAVDPVFRRFFGQSAICVMQRRV